MTLNLPYRLCTSKELVEIYLIHWGLLKCYCTKTYDISDGAL